jgi:S1-C subfamily serine protease
VSDDPDEPIGGEPGHDEGAGGEDAEDPQRGWIHPDDRLWRHPSEMAAGGPADVGASGAPTGPVVIDTPPPHRARGTVMALIGAGALVAVVVFLVVLLSPKSDNPLSDVTQDTVTGASLTTLPGAANAVPQAADAAGQSMVEMRAATTSGVTTIVGVAVAEGGLVVTTADALRNLVGLDLVGPHGRLEPATVVGTDAGSDVALVDVPEDVPVAPFADDADLAAGTPDDMLTLVSAPDSTLALHSTPGAVAAVAQPLGAGPADGMPAITSTLSPPAPSLVPGDPLLNASGAVVGILYAPASTAATASFLPTQLVVGVADDLRAGDTGPRAWLGVSGSSVPGGAGAKVASIDAGGPSVGHLQAGQVIVAVNSQPVRTMAELRGRLYVLSPGITVTLSVQTGLGDRAVVVTLGNAS